MKRLLPACLLLLLAGVLPLLAQEAETEPDAASPVRGSLVEDRAARKLLEAGDARFEVDEFTKAVEIWQSVIERYPRSKHRYEAHMRLGNYLLDRERAYDRARSHFESVSDEENRDTEQRAEATLKMGVCFYEARNYGKCFKVMRDVVEQFPVSPQVNQAYYYIGLGHFQLGHYSRAISALEKVGTALADEDSSVEKLEAGKRMFIKVEDADLAGLVAEQTVRVRCATKHGDEETVDCLAVGQNVRLVLGSLPTALGAPLVGNGILEVRGGDHVTVHYVDQHTADRKFDQPVLKEVSVVGNASVEITDGAYSESLRGVVLDRPVNLQIIDADLDTTDDADQLEALVEVYREKTAEEVEAEQAALIAATPEAVEAAADATGEPPTIDPYKQIDSLKVTFTEAKLEVRTVGRPEDELPSTEEPSEAQAAALKTSTILASTTTGRTPVKTVAQTTESETEGDATPASEAAAEANPKAPAAQQPAEPVGLHTGVFRTTVALAKVEQASPGDEVLQALPGDIIKVTYLDEVNASDEPRNVTSSARTVEGNLGGVRVTRAQISDQELRIQTQLKTASALTNIGNRYKEFGLKKNADAKYAQALKVCEEITADAMRLGGRLLEETYVQLWNIYYEMDQLELAAAMCQRLQREFPNSGFVDDALLQLADVVRKQGDMQRAVGIYTRLVEMETSQLRGEAQFGIAECYEEMAKAATGPGAAQLYDRAFQEYKRVFDGFPESGRVGEAVAKMANYYYQQKDYARAIDTFETVLANHPDAKFLDVILFNYGRCLYRLDRKADARRQFDQLIADFPESALAADAKKISDALAKAGSSESASAN